MRWFANRFLDRVIENLGLEKSSELILRREVDPSGQSRAFVNDVPVSVSSLSQLGRCLVDVHEQIAEVSRAERL